MSNKTSFSSSKSHLDGKIVLLQLATHSHHTFNQSHPNLTTRLRLSNQDIFHPVTTLSEASQVFSLKGQETAVVLAPDLALGFPQYKKLRAAVAQWVGMGGEIFFYLGAGAVSQQKGGEEEEEEEEAGGSRRLESSGGINGDGDGNSGIAEQLETIFSTFALPWKVSRVITGEFEVNEALTGLDDSSWEKLAYRYEMQALCLTGVRDHEAVYRPCAWTIVEEEEGQKEGEEKQAAIAWTDHWDGRVGFVGDLGDSVESAEALGAIMLMGDC